MLVIHVVGARPNFMKAAPVIAALDTQDDVEQQLVHTGQHYDANMSRVFFEDLGLPIPDVNLEVGSASHAIQTAEVMVRFEQVILACRPDWVIVYGDVNSTVAAALVASKLQIPVAHVEAGLRSFDRTMPEEINRVMTDRIADLLFTPSVDGNENLAREGVASERIRFVGNVMIDTLIRLLPAAEVAWSEVSRRLGISDEYGLLTLHRPSNVDEPVALQAMLTALNDISASISLVFPMHPRTRQRIMSLGPDAIIDKIVIVEPLGYIDFLTLQQHARLVITDSGGIQEETTYLGVPCITVRENTERPVTVTHGTNVLVGQDMGLLRSSVAQALNERRRKATVPPLWDGHAGERIAAILRNLAD